MALVAAKSGKTATSTGNVLLLESKKVRTSRTLQRKTNTPQAESNKKKTPPNAQLEPRAATRLIDKKTRDEMLDAHMPLVRLVAERIHRRLPPGVDLGSLIHSGIVGLLEALQRYDARRGVAMFKRVNVPVLGVVENMSYFLCPECGTRSDIFAHGGARHEAERLGVPFLGEVPLHMTIREKSDAGLPVVATEPDGPHAKIYRDIAANVLAQIKGGTASGRVAPKIVIEA